MDMENARKELVQEATDLLGTIENGLLELERSGASPELLQSIFRAAHTLKGSAGIFGLDNLVSFTHALENLLDALRSGKILISPAMNTALFEAKDLLSLMVEGLKNGEDNPDPAPELQQILRKRFTELLQGNTIAPSPPSLAAATIPKAWHISLRLSPETLRKGLDPLALFEHLETIGHIQHIETLSDSLPPPSEMNPDQLYLGFELQFWTDADRAAIEKIFEFVQEGSTIQILAPGSTVAQYMALIRSRPESSERLGEILVACGALTPMEVAKGLQMQAVTLPPERQPLGKILEETTAVHQMVVGAALQKQQEKGKRPPSKYAAEHRYVKVEVEKLDELVNQVGELVIAGAAAGSQVKKLGNSPLHESIANVQKLIESVRDASLSLRMVPIGEVFQRFPRLVRDIAKDLNKKIDLVIEGAETELDKSMVERLVDPLTHMIRNAIDHGIESVEARLAQGKSETGTVRLNAWHEGSSILIEVSDDGAGINAAKVLAKAQERGLAKPGQELSQRDILHLIFEPGFSTADQVTNLSGRGVGMDVVKRNIDDLRGIVEVETTEGYGSRFRIRLPLTLAIIDGFQFMAGGSTWVVPLDQVVECNDLSVAETYQGLVRLRGEPLPFFRLRELFGITEAPPPRESLVVVQHGTHRLGIAVDELVGELQAVIKPLGRLFRQLRGIGGTTILGNGQLAMILDVGQLVAMSEERSQTRPDPNGN
jgi:two-component system, chemotaxis family, sensor kinase CheA